MSEMPNRQINIIPVDLLGCSIQKLSVIDRLHCERVSPRWNWLVGQFGWIKQEKLNQEIALEGTIENQRLRFTADNLISLLTRLTDSNLEDLDLFSFVYNPKKPYVPPYLQEYVPRISEALKKFPKLVKLNIACFDIENFVNHFLPRTLLSINLSETFSVQTLDKLSKVCPNLEKVPFTKVLDINYEIVNRFLKKFPRQNILDLADYRLHSAHGNLISLADELKELEVLKLRDLGCFNAESFEAMTTGCQSIRTLSFWETTPMDEKSLFNLARMPNLTVLEIWDGNNIAFTDSTLRSIARRRKLKRLKAWQSPLTDDSIVFLFDHCKSLVSLDLTLSKQITNRSLQAMVSEVHRRWGNPPRALPTNPEDNEIFYFTCEGSRIDSNTAQEMTAGNPWIRLTLYDARDYI